VMLTTPYYVLGWPWRIQVERSAMFAPWVDRFNALERSVAQEHSDTVSVVDLNRYLDPDGHWTDTVAGIKVRTFDKMHLSPEGAAYVAKWLTPKLLHLDAPRHRASAHLLRELR
jgi:lysophospholipase L1-like esterase